MDWVSYKKNINFTFQFSIRKKKMYSKSSKAKCPTNNDFKMARPMQFDKNPKLNQIHSIWQMERYSLAGLSEHSSQLNRRNLCDKIYQSVIADRPAQTKSVKQKERESVCNSNLEFVWFFPLKFFQLISHQNRSQIEILIDHR